MIYTAATKMLGRVDGTTPDVARFHQVIQYIDLQKEEIILPEGYKGYVFLAFATNEGVRRNQGRVGAANGHASIAQAMASLPVHFENVILFHGGVIACEDANLEAAQQELAIYVEKILASNCTPIVLGGGHDVTYGHHLGIKNFVHKAAGGAKIGIINIDAHFDLRPIDPNIGASSGTSIWQIATEAAQQNQHFQCLALGIQKYGNTKLLFDLAQQFGVDYVLGEQFNYDERGDIIARVKAFADSVDYVYLTVCMDVFAACYAPGVSATPLNGVVPDHVFMSVFDEIVKSPKLIALDFAEVNPEFDVDLRTAKLAASMIFRTIS